MKKIWFITVGSALICSSFAHAKPKRSKKEKVEPPPQEVVVAPEPKRAMSLAERCMTYCEFTQNCLSDICIENPTVSAEVCFNQCTVANDLTEEELNRTRQAGCLRSNAVYCSSGFLTGKCDCTTAPRAECAPNQQCNIPLTENRWACGTSQGTPSSNTMPCDFFNPCKNHTVCVGRTKHASTGVCVSKCTPQKNKPNEPAVEPVSTQGVAQTSEK